MLGAGDLSKGQANSAPYPTDFDPPEQDEVNDPAESVLMIMIMMMPSKNIPTPLVLVEPWLLDQEARINLPHVP